SEQGPIVAFDARTPVHRLFEAQVARTPDAAALSCLDEQVTYATLNERANQLAHFLVARGVGPDSLVGIYTDRSIEMVLAVLAVHKAGGAYVPLDPDYPAARIEFMLRDAELPIVLTQSHRAQQLPETGATRISLDTDWPQIAIGASTNLDERATGANLAYVIYTSGSTGTPKGVMVEHRNVVNFLGGMDERVPRAESQGSQGTWLAVTSLSFDISVLELMWTLTRGFHVVLQSEAEPSAGASHGRQTSEGATPAVRPLDFSLFYFSARAETEGDPYELLWEGARWADEHGFKAVWTPERHFHAFGGLYPNPAVIGAALAARTEHVEIRSGSVVLPLHHPARVAEEWSVVDRVSNGRVGIAVAAGWMPYDFVLAPHAYAHHRERMFEAVDEVRRLWRGEAVEFPGHDGSPQAVRTLPRPVQPELPLWVTAAGNPETFRQAGAIGANLLTHLLGQSMDELRAKVAIYRQAWEEAGHPGRGTVSLMVHTFVGGNDEVARETVREPMKQYLSTAVNLVSAVAWSFPTLKSGSHAPTPDDIAKLSAEDVDALLDHAFNRYFGTSGLFGSMDTARATLGRIREADVDEVACLIDFGVETSEVVEHLEQLGELYREQAAPEVEVVDYSIGALIERHWITHLQCTPSQAYMLLADEQVRPALSGLQTLLIGGEAFPAALASSLREATPATIVNMYGPTETTIWSSTEPVSGDESMIPIGRPIANTTLYVLDPEGRRVAHGVTGELYIGGAGVVRGYLGRDALTAERFVADPFAADPAARMYRTGDRARVLEDGRVEFLGRLDFQVKIRGHRIELGEIESALLECAGVAESVVIARTDVPGEPRLAAYLVPDTGTELDASTLRTSLRGRLPAYMIPTNFVVMASFPHTPNMKVDRNALPAPSEAIEAAVTNAGQSTDDVATAIERAWAEALGVPRVAHAENFFDLGGDSLMVIRVHARLKEQLPGALSLTDFFQFPTVLDLAGEIRRRGPGAAAASPALEVATTTGASAGQRAAAARRAALARRGM
ncbi:MAG: LLM class flavin-dependent oxidoreductase, partial [Dehalococcoidia bacterium]|nr:LLM class flavin-dependent oxidoreductase [Dehalococcoidia bacterium]